MRAESKYAGPLNWQAGAYYFYEDVADNAFTYDTLFGDGSLQTYQSSRQLNNAWALFGSARYDFTDAFQLRGGVRNTRVTRSLSLYRRSPAIPP